jgi:hypothetical protein
VDFPQLDVTEGFVGLQMEVDAQVVALPRVDGLHHCYVWP